MAETFVLYNPHAGGDGRADAELLRLALPEPVQLYDITRITNYAAFLDSMQAEDTLILAGGDGTLHRFVNDTAGLTIRPQIQLFPTGAGNNFARDRRALRLDPPLPVTQALQALPTAEIDGRRRRFLTGVGLGPCPSDRHALGDFLHFRPRYARVTVDAQVFSYCNVRLAIAMHGRYFGGLIPVPDRQEGTVSLMVLHDAGPLRSLLALPGLRKGCGATPFVSIHQGRQITVEFDRPTSLQIDGETIPNITAYTVRAFCAGAQQRRREHGT